MRKYRVKARFVCDCPVCLEEEEINIPSRCGKIAEVGFLAQGVPFSDEFVAKDSHVAIELAVRKFTMIHDDILKEFEGEEGHNYRMEIQDCELLHEE